MAYVGCAVAFDSWRGLLVALLLDAWFLAAPLTEEEWLHEQFGERYEEYCSRTPRFLFTKSFRRTRRLLAITFFIGCQKIIL
ncbi:MAG: hypothetical protein Kow0069_25860 [Promethearchaeota archaeon]